MTEPFLHRPVMAEEVVELFRPVPPGVIVDATVGGGGHARRLLEARPDVRILGLDRDPRALAAAAAHLAPFGDRVTLVRSRFDHLDTIMTTWPSTISPGSCSTSACPRPSSTSPSGGSPTAWTPPSTCAWIRTIHGPPPTWSTATRKPNWPTCSRPTGTSATPAGSPTPSSRPGRSRPRPSWPASWPAPSPPPARRRGGHPAKRTFQAIRIEVNRELAVLPGAIDQALDRTRPRGPRRRARLPLGRGPHRQGALPARRHRRLHLPTGPALRVRRRGHRAPHQAERHEADGGRGRPTIGAPNRPDCELWRSWRPASEVPWPSRPHRSAVTVGRRARRSPSRSPGTPPRRSSGPSARLDRRRRPIRDIPRRNGSPGRPGPAWPSWCRGLAVAPSGSWWLRCARCCSSASWASPPSR